MNIFEKLTNVNKRYPWDVLGFILGTIGLFLFFFPPKYLTEESKPGISFQILEYSEILYLKEGVQDLNITYKNKNIVDDNLNILILKIRIKNTGDKDITKNMFDTNTPLGIQVTDGIIIEKPKIIEASTDYLYSNISLNSLDSLGKITFSDFIFDKNEYFTIRALVLFNIKSSPKINPLGKISGIKQIEITDDTYLKQIKPPLWLVITIFGIFVFSYYYLFFFLPKKWKQERGTVVKSFLASHNGTLNKSNELLFSFYEEVGLGFLHSLSFYLNKPEYIKHFTGLKEGVKLYKYNLKLYSGYFISCNKFFNEFDEYESIDNKIVKNEFKLFFTDFVQFVENENFLLISKT